LALVALLAAAIPAAASPGVSDRALAVAGRSAAPDLASELRLNPRARYEAILPSKRPKGDWGGPLCPPASELRALVDDYLSTSNPAFPGLGPTVPGLSVSWSSDDCGTFTYAAGLRSIEEGKPLTPATLMGIASMTKLVISALTLKLDEAGAFGPKGLDTTVDRLLTRRQIAALTVGDDPSNPRCPGSALLLDRPALWLKGVFAFPETAFSCPDLSQVTLRRLLVGNHGMYDYLNEVLLPSGNSQYGEALFFELFRALGLDPMPPVSSTDGFDYLEAFGLKRNDDAVIGGDLASRDFEVSFGNTGYQLLGVILEEQTGRSLDKLIRDLIVKPLGIDKMTVYVSPAERRRLIADGYDVVTGDPAFEESGVYALVGFNGHTAVNTLSYGLGLPANLTTAGGAGGLIANMQSYRAFLDAFVNGDLLGPSAKAELERSYVLHPDVSTPEQAIYTGFGLFKASIRGFPGLPDFDLLEHGGSLPGVLCENAVLIRTEPGVAPATGAMCINARENAYPDPRELWLEFIRRIPTASVPAAQPSSGRG
jgi:CubicO group peptidase (beta-lactamase class C family)